MKQVKQAKQVRQRKKKFSNMAEARAVLAQKRKAGLIPKRRRKPSQINSIEPKVEIRSIELPNLRQTIDRLREKASKNMADKITTEITMNTVILERLVEKFKSRITPLPSPMDIIKPLIGEELGFIEIAYLLYQCLGLISFDAKMGYDRGTVYLEVEKQLGQILNEDLTK